MDQGLELLFAIFWGGGRWKDAVLTAEDYAQAKAEGYIFDPVPARTHDETLEKLRNVCARISPEDVADAFLYSLSTRQLQYRSALGSYYYAISIPEHSHEEPGGCYGCGWMPVHNLPSGDYAGSGYDVLNFERYKWGGVRHTQPEYALFDLEQFLLLPKVSGSRDDREILKSILHSMNELDPCKKAGAYQTLITRKKLLKSNKSEIQVLLNILGICGVLSGRNAPCYCERFVDVYDRAPEEHSNDYDYPVNRWHVSDGVNQQRFREVFGIEFSDL